MQLPKFSQVIWTVCDAYDLDPYMRKTQKTKKPTQNIGCVDHNSEFSAG